ncbi:MAG: carboxylase [Bacteroidetes bacterium]|nr:MAG: carboxylase [Bacteroidota bacterium]
MSNKLLIRDLTLRDGQQSLFATRMKQEQIDKVLPFYKDANFYAMEVWGGAVPDSVMRFLNEDPWIRLETIKKKLGDSTNLTALSRGRNLFGYNPYPEEVIEGFNRNAIESGISIMRIFDCLNDINNMKSTIKYVKANGGQVDCAICYTIDPKFTKAQKAKAFLKGKKLPHDIFTIDYYIEKAKELEKLGADIITIKDMAGLITPSISGKLIRRLKEEIKVPIDFHTHCTPGYGLASVLMAIVNNVDIVDTNIMNFSSGPAAPAFELIQIFANKLGLDTGVNLDAVVKINNELRTIRHELEEFDNYKQLFPIEFDITKDSLPEKIDKLFDKAIELAKKDKEAELLSVIHQIENYFNFIGPNERVKNAEIPGGMYTNMLAQLKQLKLEKLVNKVLETVPIVRIDAGCPPLVTPSSQIVGVQAVNCVIDANGGNPYYTNISTQFKNLVKGNYGKTPINIDPNFREKICGVKEASDYDSSNYKKQENETICEDFGGFKLASDEKEELLLELFPSVAKNFLRNKKESEVREVKKQIIEEQLKLQKEKRERYLKLTPEEKEKRLIKGLYNYNWGSIEANPEIEDFPTKKNKKKDDK